jgi:hypothetical protein
MMEKPYVRNAGGVKKGVQQQGGRLKPETGSRI